jgi:hypothetical protein
LWYSLSIEARARLDPVSRKPGETELRPARCTTPRDDRGMVTEYAQRMVTAPQLVPNRKTTIGTAADTMTIDSGGIFS